MARRYTFGNDFPSSMDMDTDSMMTDDLNRLRDRFHERARSNRMQTDPEFDRWFETGNDAFNQRPFKIPKEDERSAYVRNIPIFQEEKPASSSQPPPTRNTTHGSNENLIHQATSAIPRSVPPPKPASPTPPLTHAYGPPPTLPKPKNSVRVTASNGSDSGIERAASGSPSDNSDSFGTTFSSANLRSGYPADRNLRASSVGRSGMWNQQEPREKTIPVKVENVPPQPPGKNEPIPMGYTKIRDPSEAIPMGFEQRPDRPKSNVRDPRDPIPLGFEQRSASAPGEKEPSGSPKTDRKSDLPKAPKPANDAGGVHRVPIVVKNVDGPRSASAPPKPTETSPPPPSTAPVKKRTPMERIDDILAGVKDLEARINAFKGTKADHEFRLVDELLTQAVIKLDGVPTDGVEEIRNARKDAVKRVHELTTKLENKGVANRPKGKTPPTQTNEKSGSPGPVGATTRIVIPMGPDSGAAADSAEEKKPN